MRILSNRILIAVCCFLRRHTPALLGLAYRSLDMLDVAYRDANEHGGVVYIGPGRCGSLVEREHDICCKARIDALW